MQAALIMQWTRPVPGREAHALELMGETNDYFGKLRADNQIAGFDWYFGTFGPNFLVARGERAVLQEIDQKPEGRKLLWKSSMLLEQFAYGLYFTGETVGDLMPESTELMKELGVM